MANLKLYFQNADPAWTPDKVTVSSGWDDVSSNHIHALGAEPSGAYSSKGKMSGLGSGYSAIMVTRFVYVLPGGVEFTARDEGGTVTGVIGSYQNNAGGVPWYGYLRWRAYVLQGQTNTLRGNVLYVAYGQDGDTAASGPTTAGEAFSTDQAIAGLSAQAGDTLVVEMGQQGQLDADYYKEPTICVGCTSETDLANNGNATAYPGWINFIFEPLDAPGVPTWDTPEGAEVWREGETHLLEWTLADPEQSLGWPCSYDIEFSADGSFTDAQTIATGVTGGSYSWGIGNLVAADTSAAKLRIRGYMTEYPDVVSDWVATDAFTVEQNTAPTITLVEPEDDALFPGGPDLRPHFVFGVADTESDPVHAELVVSYASDYSNPVVHTDSSTDYANWEKAAGPTFDEWEPLTSAGAAAGSRLRHKPESQFRYDYCYARVRATDGALTSEWTEFAFTVVVDPDLKLSVTIAGTSYGVQGMQIVENTGGDVSPISFAVSLAAYLAAEYGRGDTVAIASGLGNHNRTWNGTIELKRPAGSLVSTVAYQDDMYLEEKLCTSDQASDDLGANLGAMVTAHGSPLTGTNIATTTGVTQAIDGGYKSLREKFDQAKDLLPNFIGPWVDAGGDIHFIDQADLPAPIYRLYECVPGTKALPKRMVRYSTGGEADEVVCANLPTGYYLQVTDSEDATASAAETAGTATVDTILLAAGPYVAVGVYDGDPDGAGELVEELTTTDFDDMDDADLYAYVALIPLMPPVSPEVSTIGVKNRVYVSVKDSSPLTVAYATNDATDPKYSESPRETWLPIESGDVALCEDVADAQLAFRKLERVKLAGLRVNLTYGLGVLRGTAVWVTIPSMQVDGMYPVRRLEHRFATGDHSTSIDVGEHEYVRDLDGAVLKLGKSLVALEKEAAI